MVVPSEEEVERVRPHLSLESTNEDYIHGHLLNLNEYERQKDSKNTQRARNFYTNAGSIREESRQGGEASEKITDSPPEEGLARTSPVHHLGGCTAKHTGSSSREDA
jgi:hypothetical protein